MTRLKDTHVIIGPPGCGKTTNIARLVKQEVEQQERSMLPNPNPVIIASLTRAAAAEAAGRGMKLNPKAIGTLHSHAYRAIGCPKIAETELIDFVAKHRQYPMRAVNQADLDDVPGQDFQNSKGEKIGDQLMLNYSTLRARCVPRESWPPTLAMFADKWEAWKQANDLIDFTDMIELAIDSPPKHLPRVIMIDEAQDFSRLELRLVRSWLTAGAEALVITGDPWQSLYEWRGAFPQMFNSDKVQADHRETLSQSYRVPASVHRIAMEWTKEFMRDYHAIEYKPTARDGHAARIDASYAAPDQAMPFIESAVQHGETFMVQASCAYMLGATISMLKAAAMPFSNPWRTKHGGWNPFAKRAGVSMCDRIAAMFMPRKTGQLWTCEEFWAWVKPMSSDATRRGSKAVFERVAKATPDRIVTFDEVFDVFGDLTDTIWRMLMDEKTGIAETLNWWSDLITKQYHDRLDFPRHVASKRGIDAITEPPKVFVGTIHSFKGSEADHVMIYPDLSPNGFSTWQLPNGRDQVVRLGYVAVTRAKRCLYLAKPKSRASMPLQRYTTRLAQTPNDFLPI